MRRNPQIIRSRIAVPLRGARALPALSLAVLSIGSSSAAVAEQPQPGPTREAVAVLPREDVNPPLTAVIEQLVRSGLGSNLALQSATLEVERSQAALDAARGRFFPEATLTGRYTRAEGGGAS